jgi:hypothetical protein
MVSMMKSGWRRFTAARHLWIGLYLLKLALALVISLPALAVMQAQLDQSLYATPLLKSWSLAIVGELVRERHAVLGSLLTVLFFYTLLVLAIRQFLNGGIYSTYLSHSRLSRKEFFGRCGELFVRHVRVSGLMLIMYAILLGVGMLVASIVGGVLSGLIPDSSSLVIIVWLGIVFLFMVPGLAFSDVFRAAATLNSVESTRDTWKTAMVFFRLHWVQVVGTFLTMFVPFLVVWIVIEKLALVVTGGLGNKLGVLLELILFQSCSLIRTGQSLLVTATITDRYARAAVNGPLLPAGEVSVDGTPVL